MADNPYNGYEPGGGNSFDDYDPNAYDPGLDFGSDYDPYSYAPIDSSLAGTADSGNFGEESGDTGYMSGDVGDTASPNSYGGVRQGDDPSADNYDPSLDPSYGDNSSRQFGLPPEVTESALPYQIDKVSAPESSGPGFWSKLADSVFGRSSSGAPSSASSGIPPIASGTGKQQGNNSSTPDAITNALLKLAQLEKAVVGAVTQTKQAVNGTTPTPAGRAPATLQTSGGVSSTLVIVASVASIAGLALIFWDRKK